MCVTSTFVEAPILDVSSGNNIVAGMSKDFKENLLKSNNASSIPSCSLLSDEFEHAVRVKQLINKE